MAIPSHVTAYFASNSEPGLYRDPKTKIFYQKTDNGIIELEKKQKLGEGAHGSVHSYQIKSDAKIMKKNQDTKTAIKIIKYDPSDTELIDVLGKEIQTLEKMGLITGKPFVITRQNKATIHIPMYQIPGYDLHTYLTDRAYGYTEPFSYSGLQSIFYLSANAADKIYDALTETESEKKPYSYPPITKIQFLNMYIMLLNQLDYAHTQGIAHRDIKLDNILIDPKTGKATLVDWGSAYTARSGQSLRHGITEEMMQDSSLESEESVFNPESIFSDKTDRYALAESMAELFYFCDFKDDPDIQDFLQKSLDPNPQNRPDTEDQRYLLGNIVGKLLEASCPEPTEWNAFFIENPRQNATFTFIENALSILETITSHHKAGIYHGNISAQNLHFSPEDPLLGFIDGYLDFVQMSHIQKIDSEHFTKNTPSSVNDLKNYVSALITLIEKYKIENSSLKNNLTYLQNNSEEITLKNIINILENEKLFLDKSRSATKNRTSIHPDYKLPSNRA